MDPWTQQSEAAFSAYVDRLVEVIGHADRVVPLRDYCLGLLMPLERKSVEPMAAVTAPARTAAKHQSLLHFVGQASWSDEALMAQVRDHVLPVIERHGPIRAWIIDDTGFPKKGRHSVGVARQYCGQLGKQDNCQVAVSLSVANEVASLPIAYRLYLPQAWAEDPERRRQAKVPAEVAFQTKPEIALDQIAAAKARGVAPGTILADAGYGADGSFRFGLSALGLAYVVGVKDASLKSYMLLCASMLLCSSLQAGEQPKVVLGGTSGLPSLADPSATSAFRAAPDTGFYLHFSATDPLFTTALRSIGKVFATKQTVVEVSLGGGFTPQFWTTGWKTSVTSYGFSPHVAAVNVDMANVDAPESAPTVEIEQFETFVKAARANGGVQILAPVISPNSSGGGGLEGDARTIAIKHPWADRWWDNMRSIARFGGGIVLDAPPAFFLRALPDPAQIRAYQAFAIAELRWAAEQHLWSAFIVSPYFDAISFQSDSEKAYRILREADALPQTWIVENYSECGAPYPKACSPSDGAYRAPVGRDDLQNTEASVALWFATKAASLKIEER